MNRIQHGTDCSYGMENSGGGMAAPSKSAVAANKNSNPVARKMFSLRRKTMIKHGQMRSFFLATGFEFVYAVTAL